jgi:CIC family chloride channel protein
VGSGAPADLAPALFIGAALGGVVGHAVEALMPGYTAAPGMYALIGMGALLAGAAQAPLTALLMAFEVTNNYQTILPVMLACAISATIARRYAKESVYTMKLARRGINLRLAQERNLLRALTVKDAMTRETRTVPETMKFGDLLDLLAHSRHIDFPVVDAAGRLSGVISFQDIREVAFEKGLEDLLIVRDLMSRNVITVTERDDLHTALERIGSRNIESLPVVDVHDRRHVVGMLSRRDVVTAYNRAIHLLRTPPAPAAAAPRSAVPLRPVEDDDLPG